jgi:hypothetical protein
MTTPQSRSARLVRWLLASGAGLALALAVFKRYVQAQVTAPLDRALLLVYLVGVFTLVGYGLLFRVALPRLRAAGRAPVAWSLGALAAGCLLAALLALRPVPRPHTLELIATGQRNPAARGSEVWVTGLYRADGSQVAVSELTLEGDWEIRDGVPLSYRNQPATLRWTGVLDGDAVLRLLAHPWSGVVQVRWDGRTETIDLYADAATTRELALPHVPPVGEPWAPVLRGVFFGADAISLGLGLLVIASIGMYHARVRPLGNWTAVLGGKELTFRGWPTVRALGIWAAVLALGLVVLSGRYDWSSAVYVYSLRGYVSSAYMFVVFLPALYYTLDRFIPSRRVVLGITAVVAVLLTLPYRWLSLDRFYYYANRRQWYNLGEPGVPLPKPDWFPGALSRLPAIPHESLIFGGLVLAGVVIAALFWQYKPKPLTIARNRAILGFYAIYGIILLQTWLHLSLRSPYSYVPHYERPPDANYWYVVYTFPKGKGAVNADLFVFRALDDYFSGIPHDVNLMLIRRSLPFYLTSHFSYFVNSFYVFLIFNIALWFCAVICGYLVARDLWDDRVALFTALMIAGGSGFIMYVGQPMNYLAGYASIIIIIYLFYRIVLENEHKSSNFLLFGVLLGLFSMIYDIFHMYLFFFGYLVFIKQNLRRIFLSLIIALIIYEMFLFIQTNVLEVSIDQSNVKEAIEPFSKIVQLVVQPHLGEWYILLMTFFERYFGHLGRVFFVYPLIPALFGIALIKSRIQAVVILLLFVPSIAALAYLHFGGTYVAAFSRIIYIAYPGVYMLAALSLDRIFSMKGGTLRNRLSSIVPWVFIGIFFILNNIDVFGFPMMYYHFYHSASYAWPVKP